MRGMIVLGELVSIAQIFFEKPNNPVLSFGRRSLKTYPRNAEVGIRNEFPASKRHGQAARR